MVAATRTKHDFTIAQSLLAEFEAAKHHDLKAKPIVGLVVQPKRPY